MKIIAGTHGTGKTRSLLLTAEKCGKNAIVYCANPTKVRQIIYDLGISNVYPKSYASFWEDEPAADEHWFIDDIAACVESHCLPIEGFTINLD